VVAWLAGAAARGYLFSAGGVLMSRQDVFVKAGGRCRQMTRPGDAQSDQRISDAARQRCFARFIGMAKPLHAARAAAPARVSFTIGAHRTAWRCTPLAHA
jgi:hypothetical protein